MEASGAVGVSRHPHSAQWLKQTRTVGAGRKAARGGVWSLGCLGHAAGQPWSVPSQPVHCMDFVSREQFVNFTKQLRAHVLLIK